MEKKVGEQYLFNFYGELLTDKQKRILEYYYDDDYTLAEIAEVMSVTRQGIFDVIKRTRAIMESYEKKLGLIAGFLESQRRLQEIEGAIKGCAAKEKDAQLKAELMLVADAVKQISEENER